MKYLNGGYVHKAPDASHTKIQVVRQAMQQIDAQAKAAVKCHTKTLNWYVLKSSDECHANTQDCL